jgi:hypothetical protein
MEATLANKKTRAMPKSCTFKILFLKKQGQIHQLMSK